MKDLVGMKESHLTIQKIAYRLDCGPVTEHLLVIFETLGLILLGDVDRLGASDMDIVGVQEVRKGR